MISDSTIVANTSGFLLRASGQDDIALAGEHSVGRESDCDIRIVDKLISRYHARLSITGSGIVVEDLGSTNGTYLNGVRIRGAMSASLGDTISFHKTVYRVVSDCSNDADVTVYGGDSTRTVSLKAPVAVAAYAAKEPVAAAKPSRVARKTGTKRTAIERQLQMQLIEDESYLQRIADLATGVWIEFKEFKGRAYACCVLSAGGNLGEQCLLVPGSGFGVIEKSCRDIGVDIQRGKARILEAGPWYGRLAMILTGALRRVEHLEDAKCS
jgi:hypothetical protein